MTVATIADEIYRELDEPSDASIPSISFWLTSNIGKLNNIIDTDYVIEGGEIVPELGEEEKSIFKLMYEIHYYTRQVNKNLGAAAYTSILEVKEGNRSVRRANKTEVAKSYRGLIADLNDDLEAQVLNYKMNLADPLQLIVPNPILTESAVKGYVSYDRDSNRNDLM